MELIMYIFNPISIYFLNNQPLFVAVENNNIEIVQSLLKFKEIDVNKCNILKTWFLIIFKKSILI